MPGKLYDMLETITDEKSFIRFLTALREDCEGHERNCNQRDRMACIEGEHWETHNTTYFLKSVENWAARRDFADGMHHREPLLQRFATMLLVGRHYRPEDRPR